MGGRPQPSTLAGGMDDDAHDTSTAADVPSQRSPLELLLDVQDHDLELDRLAYRLRELTERGALAALEERRGELGRRFEAVEVDRAELARQQDELDKRVQAVVARIDAIDARLRSGAAGSYRDQDAMANETRSLDHQRRDLEDRELEIMEQLEPVEAELAAIAAELERLESEREGASGALAAAEALIAAERDQVTGERAPLAVQLPAGLLSSYERLRAKLGGIGAARLVDGACSGCHLRLPSKERDEVVHAPKGTIFYCDQCGRILVP